jgi:hypothetical protein
MRLAWPPLPIVIVCVLTTVSAALQASHELATASVLLSEYPPGWELAGYAILALVVGFFVLTLVGLWRMRRWAAIARLAVHAIAPVQMTIVWSESWERYPMLGPFVSWFWFGVIAICILPYWGKMSWRFP